MILWRFIYVCVKFHTDMINQTVIRKEFVKVVWGKWKLFRGLLNILGLGALLKLKWSQWN